MKIKWIYIFALVLGLASQVDAARVGLFGSHWEAGNAGEEIGYGALIRMDAGQGLFMDLRGSWYEFKQSSAGQSRTLRLIPLEIALLTSYPGSTEFAPYFGGGWGYYIADGDVNEGAGSTSLNIDNEFGYFLVGGLDIRLSRSVRFFAEAKYAWVRFSDVETEDGVDQPNIKADGLAINVGLILRW